MILLQRSRHHQNIQTLTTEVFKVMKSICLPIMETFFDFREADTTSENSKKWDSEKLQLSDIVSKQLFTALLNYGLLFLQI